MDDCIIVGAGPAGLTAALYLTRYHLSIRLFDCGTSRAELIPRTHNLPGFPGGISGTDLLERMLEQGAEYGVEREEAKVTRIVRQDEGFEVFTEDGQFTARTVLIATGVFNLHPPRMEDELHDAALMRGLLRYCPICDGFEVTDKRVGVIGTGRHGAAETMFLRAFTADLTLIAPDGEHELDAKWRQRLDDAGIEIVEGPCTSYTLSNKRIAVETGVGPLIFDSIYSAMGSDVRSGLATAAGARVGEDGALEVDDHQRTSVEGLFAAGDVAKGLDQISHAMGEAGVAATTIRNYLATKKPLWR
ncbi:NAD(P)/FAD-dependent oxidoreductase [Altericroceibacterium xinjiangense]|uniref:NAD(P)/FAD-dependent oxidoreductase n=1 Tax=Altericroceibacterium xinjiangense TaxID=762261 RepID=UPI000F7E38F8|nr:NAD(P)/FAD-dependent oxidoreductase [Altericroceibacterium xinjiangense]